VKLNLEGKDFVIHGRLCRVAHVDGDGYKFLTDPESAIAALRGSNKRADLFMFTIPTWTLVCRIFGSGNWRLIHSFLLVHFRMPLAFGGGLLIR
jgi:hypothetical protein